MVYMIILGIDPGLNATGWGIINSECNRLTFISCGTIKNSSHTLLQDKILHINYELSKIIKNYTPDTVSLEEIFVNKNPLSSIKLAHARGAIMLTVAVNMLKIHEYKPTTIKKSITGKGHADKDQMKFMVKQILPIININNDHNAIDALGIAICHSLHYNSIINQHKNDANLQ